MDRAIRVMVVDDTDHVRAMLGVMLGVDGFEVVAEAASGPAALEAATRADPDVVVMDYKMPAMDGLEAARRIRAARPTQQVILYTAFIDEGLETAAAAAGVALCLGKIEGLGLLEQEIRRLCRHLLS